MPAPVAHMTTAEASAYLGISTRTLEGWRRKYGQKRIPYTVPPGTRMVRYKVADLDAFMAAGRVTA